MKWEEGSLGHTRSYCPHMGTYLANACTHDATGRSVCADSLSADRGSKERTKEKGERRREESEVAGRKCGERPAWQMYVKS